MPECPITAVVCGPEIDLEGRPVVDGNREVEVLASPEMLIGELAETVMTILGGENHREEEGHPRWQLRLMPGYEVVPNSESTLVYPPTPEGTTQVLQSWDRG